MTLVSAYQEWYEKNHTYPHETIPAALREDSENTEVTAVSEGIPTDAKVFYLAIDKAYKAQNMDGARDDSPMPENYARGASPKFRWGFEVYVKVDGSDEPMLYPVAVHRDLGGDIIITVAKSEDVIFGVEVSE